MRFPWLIILCFFLPVITFAQSGVISGIVTNSESKRPIPRASIFLSNSSVGSATSEDGKYTLSNIRPGQYTLVVTVLGYETYNKTVLIGREPIKLDIGMASKPLRLREVVISSAADWKKNYEWFRKDFIGVDDNAKSCIVQNPHILNLVYNRTKQTLEASGDEFLVVDNKALGYRVKFLLKGFKSDKISNIIFREGQQLFEDLPGSAEQKKKWHQKREEAYYGSAMHFYRSLSASKLNEEGFTMYMLRRALNPLRPLDEVIRHKVDIFRIQRNADSANYWAGLGNMSKWYKENLNKIPLIEYEVFSKTQQPGIYAVHFLNYLYVTYNKRRDEVYDRDLYRPLEMPNYETTILTLMNPYVLFDSNGIVVDGPPLYEGAWAKSRLSDLLPVDYVPDVK
jgi:hypothetical protein